MLYCDCYQPDYRSGSGDGYVFCNANNVCECPVADGGNSQYQCCTADSGDLTGVNGCKSGCKSMHFHYPSIAFPFRCHYETKPLLSSFVFTFAL